MAQRGSRPPGGHHLGLTMAITFVTLLAPGPQEQQRGTELIFTPCSLTSPAQCDHSVSSYKIVCKSCYLLSFGQLVDLQLYNGLVIGECCLKLDILVFPLTALKHWSNLWVQIICSHLCRAQIEMSLLGYQFTTENEFRGVGLAITRRINYHRFYLRSKNSLRKYFTTRLKHFLFVSGK